MNWTSVKLFAALLAGLILFSAPALATQHYSGYPYGYTTPGGNGYSGYHRYPVPVIGPGGLAAGGTAAQPQPQVPATKSVTINVRSLFGNQPLANASVGIYAQVGLGPGEIRGSGVTGSDGKVVISGISNKWHVIIVRTPGRPLAAIHYLPPNNASDTFRV